MPSSKFKKRIFRTLSQGQLLQNVNVNESGDNFNPTKKNHQGDDIKVLGFPSSLVTFDGGEGK